MDSLSLFLVSLAAAQAAFALLFFVAKRINNFGIVDIAWAAGFAPVAVFHALFAQGLPSRRWIIATMATLWSLRLGGHLARRVLGLHPIEDGRYRQLRIDWAGRFDRTMFLFFQAQGLLVVLLSMPFLLAARNAAPHLNPLEIAGAGLWCVALAGEALADLQLVRFRRDPANRGRVCDVGLWGLSRHPNYFFEWLVWVAFALFAAGSPWGWTAFACPALMLFLLLKVTGIRYTEEQLLRSKGEAYRAYQARVPAFIPRIW